MSTIRNNNTDMYESIQASGDVIIEEGDKNTTINTTLNQNITNNYSFNNPLDRDIIEKLTGIEEYHVFNKKYVKKFVELENYLFKKMFDTDKVEHHFKSAELICGKQIIDWLVDGGVFPVKSLEKMYRSLQFDFEFTNDDLIVKRWNANLQYYNRNYQLAEDAYKELLPILEEKSWSYNWFRDDVCIDGRNITNKNEQSIGILFNPNNPFQLLLNSNKHQLSHPDADRLRTNVLNSSIKHVMIHKHKNKLTNMYGIGLEQIMSDIQELVLVSIFYGSITHLDLVREIILRVFLVYDSEFEDEVFYKGILKMQLLLNEFDGFSNYYSSIYLSRPSIHNEEFIDELFHVTNYIDEELRKSDIIFYRIYGDYLSDEKLVTIEGKILDILEEDKHPRNSNQIEIIKAIHNNFDQFKDKESLFNILTLTANKNYQPILNAIFNLLNDVALNLLTKPEYEKCRTLMVKVSKKDKRYSSLVIKIIDFEEKEEMFDLLDLNDFLTNLNYIEIVEKDFNKLLKLLILEIEKAHKEVLDKPGVYVFGGSRFNISNKFFDDDTYSNNIKETLYNDFLNLSISILNCSTEYIDKKIEVMRTINSWLLVDNALHKNKKLKETVIGDNIFNYNTINLDGFIDKMDIVCHQQMIKFVYGIIDQSQLINEYINISTKNDKYMATIMHLLILNNRMLEKDAQLITFAYSVFIKSFNKNDIDTRKLIPSFIIFFKGNFLYKNVTRQIKDKLTLMTFNETKSYISAILAQDSFEENIKERFLENLRLNKSFKTNFMIERYT